MLMDRIALVLTIIGGINWGSVGLFRFDLVAWLFGGQTATVILAMGAGKAGAKSIDAYIKGKAAE